MARFAVGGCVATAIVVAISPARAQEKTSHYSRHGHSSFAARTGGGRDSYRIVNTTFVATEAPTQNRRGVERLLLEQRLVSNQDWETDASRPLMTVTARVMAHGRFEKSLWSFRENADRGEIWSDYYRSVMRGREGAEDLYSYHRLATGRLEFYASTEPLAIRLANRHSEERLVTYLSNRTDSDVSISITHPSAIGLLAMRQEGKVVDQVVVVANAGTSEESSPKITAKDALGREDSQSDDSQTVTLSKRKGLSDPLAWSGFNVYLRYVHGAEKPVIVIPVKDGRFNIEAASVPNGINLVREVRDARPARSR